MNAETGRIYELPEGIVDGPGVSIPQAFVPGLWDLEKAHRAHAKHEEATKARELRRAIERDEPLVTVSAEVVQRLRLGDRELRRRRQRRR